MSEPTVPPPSGHDEELTSETEVPETVPLDRANWLDSATAPGSMSLEALNDALLLLKLYSPGEQGIGAVRVVGSDPILIGRGEQLFGEPMRDTRISRQHAVVEYDTHRACHLITDKGSRNGTFMNGLRIKQERLRPGDLIRIGDTVMEVVRMDPTLIGWRAREGSYFTGTSAALCTLTREIAKVAPQPISVLITGETGVGKELTAREVHRLSERKGDLVAVNCAAIPKDLFESEFFGHVKGAFSGANQSKRGLFLAAHDGTLFLDEVGELDLSQQAKLLRVLQEQEVRPVGATTSTAVNVRVIAATNRDLSKEVSEGRFREDLLARIRSWTLDIPPLRDRRADLLPIAKKTLDELDLERERSLSAGFYEALALYDWPANVRQLVHSVQHAAIQVSDVDMRLVAKHLPPEVRERGASSASPEPSSSPVPPGVEPTREELIQLLHDARGRVANIARHTGRQRTQVYRWIKRYGLDVNDYRSHTDTSES